ncbi:MAG: hypothetical protein INQ03_08070 [Candidatus Heimdallarchaeota archaeon]|nr:hypothetical protein [Candidatus Heimdallarchaeota archaeon]
MSNIAFDSFMIWGIFRNTVEFNTVLIMLIIASVTFFPFLALFYRACNALFNKSLDRVESYLYVIPSQLLFILFIIVRPYSLDAALILGIILIIVIIFAVVLSLIRSEEREEVNKILEVLKMMVAGIVLWVSGFLLWLLFFIGPGMVML